MVSFLFFKRFILTISAGQEVIAGQSTIKSYRSLFIQPVALYAIGHSLYNRWLFMQPGPEFPRRPGLCRHPGLFRRQGLCLRRRRTFPLHP